MMLLIKRMAKNKQLRLSPDQNVQSSSLQPYKTDQLQLLCDQSCSAAKLNSRFYAYTYAALTVKSSTESTQWSNAYDTAVVCAMLDTNC